MSKKTIPAQRGATTRTTNPAYRSSTPQKVLAVLLAITLCLPTSMTNALYGTSTAQAAEPTTEETSGSGENTGDTNGDVTQTDEESSNLDKGSSDSNDANDSNTVGDTNSSGDANNSGDAENTNTGTAEESSTDSSTQQTTSLSAIDWTSQSDALALSSTGLTLDEEALQAYYEELTAEDATEGEGEEDAATDAAAEPALPEQIAAALNLSFTLDYTQYAATDSSVHNAVVPGDYFTIALPDGFALADSTATIDVFQLNDDGTASTVKIAEAALVNGSLKVTFCEPTDTATGAAALDVESASAATSTEGATQTTLKASIDLSVLFESSLVGEEETDVTWVSQTKSDGTVNNVVFTIPSKASVLEAMGYVAEADVPMLLSLFEDEVTVAYIKAATKQTLSSARTGEATLFTTLWADNNSSSRPSVNTLTTSNEYVIYFKTSSMSEAAPLYTVDSSGNISVSDAAAKSVEDGGLGLENSDLVTLFNGTLNSDGTVKATPVTITNDATNQYTATATGLPTSIDTYTQRTETIRVVDGNSSSDIECAVFTDSNSNKYYQSIAEDSTNGTYYTLEAEHNTGVAVTDSNFDSSTLTPIYEDGAAATSSSTITYTIQHAYYGGVAASTAISDASGKVYATGSTHAGPNGNIDDYYYQIAGTSSVGKIDASAEGSYDECLQLLKTVTFTAYMNVGDLTESIGETTDAFGTWAQVYGQYQTLTVTGSSLSADQTYSGEAYTNLFNNDDGTGTFVIMYTNDAYDTVAVTGQVPAYASDSTKLTYSLKQDLSAHKQTYTSDGQTFTDEYTVTYDNTDETGLLGTDACYSGGTMTITHVGTTDFDATKVWADEEQDSRPETTFTLWRYSTSGAASNEDYASIAYKSAVQVQNSDGSYVTIKVDAKSETTVDLGALLFSQNSGLSLAKYDPDGYAYVYLLREDSITGYSATYSNIGSNYYTNEVDSESTSGAFTTTKFTGTSEGVRPDDDPSIYNGETVTNVATENITVTAEKTWEAAAFQDQLSDIAVELTLQRTLGDASSESAEWTTVKETVDGTEQDVTVILTDWTAENLTQTVSETYPQYNSEGKKYTYRWVETNIGTVTTTTSTDETTQETVETDSITWFTGSTVAKDSAGAVTSFQLALTNNQGNEFTATFNSGWENDGGVTTEGEDTEYTTTVTNTYINTAVEKVAKWWNIGGSNYTQDSSVYGPYYTSLSNDSSNTFTYTASALAVEVTLYQNGRKVGTYTLDGNVDENDTVIAKYGAEGTSSGEGIQGTTGSESGDATYREDSAWNMTFNLPEYDENGGKYDYVIVESGTEGGTFNSSRSYEGTWDSDLGTNVYTTKIYNTPAVSGEYSEYHVTKSWVDGGNGSSRVPVIVGVYAKVDLASKATAEDSTTPLYSYSAGQLIDLVVLAEDNSWYTEGYLNIDGVDYKTDLSIKELDFSDSDVEDYYSLLSTEERSMLGITDTSASYDDVKTTYEALAKSYNIISRDDALSDEYDTYDNLLINWSSDSTTERMVTGSGSSANDYVYEITYDTNSAMSALEVNNRRLGQVWITVNKDWIDAGATSDDRPQSSIAISCESATFSIDTTTGNVYVQLGSGNNIQVYKSFNENNVGTALNSTDGVSVSKDGHTLYIAVNRSTDSSTSTYTAFALPKYDDSGNMATYEVTEAYPTDYSGAYTDENEVEASYNVSTWHFRDNYTYTFTNQRTGTKSATFYLDWDDAYVYSVLNQRPDIYLTLYKTVYEYTYSYNGVEYKSVEAAAESGIAKEDLTATLQYETTTDSSGNEVKTPVYSLEAVDGYVNYKWSSTGDSGQYAQTCTINDLEGYDEWGKEIVYYATASTLVSTATLENLDYAPQRHYTTSLNGGKGNAAWDEHNADDEIAAVAAQVNMTETAGTEGEGDRGKALREDGTFNFYLEGDVDVSGTKTWANIPGNVSATDLPAISIYIQRKLASDTNTSWSVLTTFEASSDSNGITGYGYDVVTYNSNGSADYTVADGETVVAYTDDLVQISGSNEFSWTIQYYGNNVTTTTGGTTTTNSDDSTLLPKYDSNGNLYEYRSLEIIDGLIIDNASDTSQAGFTLDQLVAATTESDFNALTSSVYTTTQGGAGVMQIQNAYTGTTGSLSIQKVYNGDRINSTSESATADDFPETTFTLYRYYVKSDGTKSDALKVAEQTLTAEDAVEGSGTSTITFNDVAVYAPTGNYWVYYVEETDVNDYSTTVKIGNGETSTAVANETNGTVTSGDLNARSSTTSEGTYSQPTSTPVSTSGASIAVTFTNTYDPDATVELEGTKGWDDYSNLFNTRPENLTLTVTRTSTSGQTEVIPLTVVKTAVDTSDTTSIYIVWDKTSVNNTWSYTIYNLERWAPDGSLWTYSIEETVPDGYNGSVSSASATTLPTTDPTDGSVDGTFGKLENELVSTVTVNKVWSETDTYRLQPSSVTVLLQAKLTVPEGTTTSATIDTWGNAFTIFTSTGLTSDQLSSATSLTSTDVSKTLNAYNAWSTSWPNLPASITVTNSDSTTTTYTVEYRAVETAIGSTSVSDSISLSSEDLGTGNGYVIDSYNVTLSTSKSSESGNASATTTITNTLNATSVTVTKTWAGDSENAYRTRPGTSATDAE